MSRLTTNKSNDDIRNKAISIIRNLTAENGLSYDELGVLSSFLLIERTENTMLKHYEDLEEQLEKLYGDRLSLDKVVENLNRVVQNGEEKLDYARILTNAEAEKWDRWKSLEEQGRLIELPCAVGDTVYEVQKIRKRIQEYTVTYVNYDNHSLYYGWRVKDGKGIYSNLNGFDEFAIGKTVFLNREEAEAKLAEMEGAE